MSDLQLELKNVSVSYDAGAVVSGVSLGLQKGHIGCFLGPSGCGKTSLLRAVAGFQRVSEGEVALAGDVVSCLKTSLAPEKRDVGMVFQDFALFPHLTVEQNIAFGLRKHQNAESRVSELLSLTNLSDARGKYPHELSGGMQQRVAVARAMAPRPKVLLLDEPFSSIDSELREQLATEIRTMLLRDGMTGVLVTHDQNEAFAMADRIGVFGDGKLRQWGTASELYHSPADTFVAGFIGLGTLVSGHLKEGGVVSTSVGEFSGISPERMHGPSGEIKLLVRPEHVTLDQGSPYQMEVVRKVFRGDVNLYTLRDKDGQNELLSFAPHGEDLDVGSVRGVRVGFDKLGVFPKQAAAE